MPSRIIREGFLDSERVAELADWWAECVYHRLLLAADDAGRIDGRPRFLVARLFPLQSVRVADVERALAKCRDAKLVTPYECAGKPYLQVMRWAKQGSTQNSYFPWRDGSYAIRYVAVPCQHGVREYVVTSVDVDGDGVKTGSAPAGEAEPTGSGPGTEGVRTPCGPPAEGVRTGSGPGLATGSGSGSGAESGSETDRGGTPPLPLAGTAGAAVGAAGHGGGRKAVPELPDDLAAQDPDLAAAWAEWIAFRKERKPAVTPRSAAEAFRMFRVWGPAKSVAAIRHSVMGGYQGLFEPREKPAGQTARKVF